jgi:hypothetical protein
MDMNAADYESKRAALVEQFNAALEGIQNLAAERQAELDKRFDAAMDDDTYDELMEDGTYDEFLAVEQHGADAQSIARDYPM